MSSTSLAQTGSLTLRPLGYPVEWEADVVLRDGSVAHVRPITPADGAAMRTFHAGQSEESIYLRFFAPLRELSDKDIHRFTVVDYDERVALVVTLRDDIIGIGRYDKVDASTAEVAFNISDHYHGKGIGSILLEHLAAIGFEAGVTKFVAEVLPQNRKMINVFKEAGYGVKHRLEDGVISLSFDITPTAKSLTVRYAREHRAESSSVRGILTPRSVAVVGASRRPHSIGQTLLRNILEGGFTGEVYAVNPSATEVLGLPTYHSVSEIPGEVDLAVIAAPAEHILEIVDDCAVKGVRALLITSAGFAESDDAGRKLQTRMRKRARRAGMRVIGPNSFGFINNDPAVSLNASLAPQVPPAGSLGLFAQSGALGIAVLASVARRGLGVSVFASAGNRVDLSSNDLLQYWIDDDGTHAVGLYVESMGNPRKFSRIARHLAMTKPVIVVKSGEGTLQVAPGVAGRHTQLGQDAFDAMLRQAGVIRAENLHQLFDIAQLVAYQPLPAGNRVAIVTNSAALSSLTAQSARSWRLEVTHGPVSVSPEGAAEEFTTALQAAFDDPNVDSVLTAFVPPVYTDDEHIATAVRDISGKSEKPCAATFLGMRGVTESLAMPEEGGRRRRVVPAYGLPEDAVRALAAATRYGEWRSRQQGEPVDPTGVDDDAAGAIIARVLAANPDGRELTPSERMELLAAYGIDLWTAETVHSADEAVEAAERCGYPVILKSRSPALRHQVGLGGIRADLVNADAVRQAFQSLTDRLGSFAGDPFAIQRMSPPGVSCVLRSAEDPFFGPVVSFSVAGPPTDLLGDIGHRIPPLTDVDVADLVNSVKAAPMLTGHRGTVPIKMDALHDLIARISVMAERHPDLAHVSLQPVNCYAGGVDVLGAEIVVHPAVKRKDASRRALS